MKVDILTRKLSSTVLRNPYFNTSHYPHTKQTISKNNTLGMLKIDKKFIRNERKIKSWKKEKYKKLEIKFNFRNYYYVNSRWKQKNEWKNYNPSKKEENSIKFWDENSKHYLKEKYFIAFDFCRDSVNFLRVKLGGRPLKKLLDSWWVHLMFHSVILPTWPILYAFQDLKHFVFWITF